MSQSCFTLSAGFNKDEELSYDNNFNNYDNNKKHMITYLIFGLLGKLREL